MSFIEYIESGNLEKSKEYLKDNPEYDIHADNEYAFRRSCYYGHLEAAKWLYELDGKIDIHANNDMAFRWSCEKGYIEIAKWLYGLDGKINIHANYNEAFRWSCHNGHFEVAKWLYGLSANKSGSQTKIIGDVMNHQIDGSVVIGNIDIHANNERAFRVSCCKGNIEIAIWLYGLDKEYYNKWIIDNNIENEIVRDKIMEMRLVESKLDIDDGTEICI
jgi:hypothetical protein